MPVKTIKSAAEVLRDITRAHGEDVVVLGSQMKGRTIGRMSTGVLSYDAILGGGWPVGSWSEVIGNESHGKTLLAQSTVITGQRRDPKHRTLWIAGEPVNFEWCETLGMDLERVEFVPGNNMEMAYDIALKFMENRLVDLVIIDSLPSLIPTSEDDREFDELTIGRAAMLNNKFFVRKATTAMKRSYTRKDRPCTGIAINQWRDRVGVTHGDPRIAPGGLGKNFAFYVRVDMTRTEWIKNGTMVVGGRFRMRTIKNKVAPVNRSAEINFYFDAVPGFERGRFDHVEDIVAAGLYYDVFGVGGGGYYVFGEHRWRGKDKLVAGVREDLDLQAEIRGAVMHVVNPEADARKVRIVARR
jgi:recombination protein RecA